MKQIVKLRTEWGPVELELLDCDGCGTLALETLSVGWLEVKPIGNVANTMGNSTETEHYCSRSCLTH